MIGHCDDSRLLIYATQPNAVPDQTAPGVKWSLRLGLAQVRVYRIPDNALRVAADVIHLSNLNVEHTINPFKEKWNFQWPKINPSTET